MQCPQCKGYELQPAELEQNLVVGRCDKCAGSLLSLTQYRFWVDRQTPCAEHLKKEPVITEDDNKIKTCPKCQHFMSKFSIGNNELSAPDSENRLDLCAGCDEVWFAKGEWLLLKQLGLQLGLTAIFTEAWQRQLRMRRQETHFKSHFQQLLGDDTFNKVDDFKQWLSQQDNKDQIKHYINTPFK